MIQAVPSLCHVSGLYQGLQVVEEISNMVTLGYTTPLSDDIAYRQCIQSSTETHNQTAISV